MLEKANGLFGKRVLDVGCGGGILAESMAREGAQVTGLDMGKEPLEVARLHALETVPNSPTSKARWKHMLRPTRTPMM